MPGDILHLPDFAAAGGIEHGFSTRATDLTRFAGANDIQVRQVHEATVLRVTPASLREATKTCTADALVSDVVGKRLMIQTADCLPVLFWDARHRAIGAAHAGWRGMAKGILQQVIQVLTEQYRCEPQDLRIALGPSIGGCCFEVGGDVREAFCGALNARALFFRPGKPGKWLADLKGLAREILEAQGIPAKAIHQSDLCTVCHAELFYSYRRDGAGTGRQVNFISLLPPP